MLTVITQSTLSGHEMNTWYQAQTTVSCMFVCVCFVSLTVQLEIWSGNFFIWDKTSGELLDIHEGDESIVNVVCL